MAIILIFLPAEENKLYYLYFSYAFIVAVWVFFDSLKTKASQWWTALIFFSPVTAPFYFLQPGVKKRILPALIACLFFAGVCTGEYFIHFNKKIKLNYSHYPPIAKQMVKLSLSMKILTNEFDKNINKFKELSLSESSLENMAATVEAIGNLRLEIIKNKAAIHRLTLFSKGYEKVLKQENFGWLTAIGNYYNNEVMVLYFKKLKLYLDSFESLLQFTFKHFNEIEKRVPVALDNYDAYYLRYRGAMDDYNRAGNIRIKFQNNFLNTNPYLKEFLPDNAQVNSLELKSKLKLWD